MSPSDPPDDVVAEMLKADAKNSALRFARIGLGELLPRRPTKEAPKPNLRFLRNVLKETEGHNAALREANERNNRPQQDHREERSRRDERSHRSSRRRRSGSRSRSRSPDRRRRRYRSRSRSTSPRDSKRYKESYKSRSSKSRRHDSKERQSRKHRHKSSYSPSPERHRRSLAPERSSPAIKRDTGSKTRNRSTLDEDSDPLEDIIGPLPPRPESPVRKRGRGAFTSTSAMDAHFAPDYDPSMDVRPDSDDEEKGEDWDQKVEVFRDRQKWRQQGADRLRQAGFTEDQIRKWEKSEQGDEKGEEDVKWNKRGEGREWDRGKVVDEDGVFVQRPEWGRLKGT